MPKISLTVKPKLAMEHLMAAKYFAQTAHDIENSQPLEYLERKRNKFKYSFYSMSAIFSSVAFLEANINEFIESCISNDRIVNSVSDRYHLAFVALNDDEVPKKLKLPILSKYNSTLKILELEEFEHSAQPYQDISLVVRLRNMLTHHDPEEVTTDIEIGESFGVTGNQLIEKQLRNKFSTNPFTGLGNPFFPDKAISAGCAAWAADSALEFVDDFYERVEILPDYQKFGIEF